MLFFQYISAFPTPMNVDEIWQKANYMIFYCKTYKIIPTRSLQEYAIVVDMIALINTILNKSSIYSESVELFVNHIPNGYGRVDIIADCYKTMPIKSSTVKRSIRKDPYSITSFKGSK